MSESTARSVSVAPPRSSTHGSTPRLAPDVESMLALCREAVDPHASADQFKSALEALEDSLPKLEASDVAALTGDPGYRLIRNDLLRACAAYWFARECELARQALDGPAHSTLHRLFGGHIPREAYADELAVLHSVKPQRILILGSGPCPMSAIVIQDVFPAVKIVGIDRSEEACELSSRLLTAAGYTTVEVRHGDASGPARIDGFDCVLMALTVGENEAEKRRIIGTLRNAADPDATLVVRTAVGWGRVLYPTVDIPEIADKALRQTVRTPYQRSVAVAVRVAELAD